METRARGRRAKEQGTAYPALYTVSAPHPAVGCVQSLIDQTAARYSTPVLFRGTPVRPVPRVEIKDLELNVMCFFEVRWRCWVSVWASLAKVLGTGLRATRQHQRRTLELCRGVVGAGSYGSSILHACQGRGTTARRRARTTRRAMARYVTWACCRRAPQSPRRGRVPQGQSSYLSTRVGVNYALPCPTGSSRLDGLARMTTGNSGRRAATAHEVRGDHDDREVPVSHGGGDATKARRDADDDER